MVTGMSQKVSNADEPPSLDFKNERDRIVGYDMDMPPPLDGFNEKDFIAEQPEQPIGTDDATNVGDAPMMDRMVAAATIAKERKMKIQAMEKQRMKKSFGNGLKKGFFSASNKETNKCKANVQKEKKKSEIPTIRPTEPRDKGLQFPEVQAAFEQFKALDPKEWMTPDFMAKLAKNSCLCAAFQNPRFTDAINLMKENPKEAMRKYQNDKDLQVMMMEYMQFMGHHFEELGRKQIAKTTTNVKSKEQIQRDAIAAMERSPDEETQIQKILDDQDLQNILSDPEMQKILQQCQEPRHFKQYVADPIIGKKIKKLIDAGLVRLHS